MTQKESALLIVIVVVLIILFAGAIWYYKMNQMNNKFGQPPSIFENGQEVSIQGTAINDAFAGAAIDFTASGAAYRVYIENLKAWPADYLNKEVVAKGVVTYVTDVNRMVPGAYTLQMSGVSYSLQ